MCLIYNSFIVIYFKFLIYRLITLEVLMKWIKLYTKGFIALIIVLFIFVVCLTIVFAIIADWNFINSLRILFLIFISIITLFIVIKIPSLTITIDKSKNKFYIGKKIVVPLDKIERIDICLNKRFSNAIVIRKDGIPSYSFAVGTLRISMRKKKLEEVVCLINSILNENKSKTK